MEPFAGVMRRGYASRGRRFGWLMTVGVRDLRLRLDQLRHGEGPSSERFSECE